MKKYIITAALSVFSMLSVSAQAKKNTQVSLLYQNYISIKSALASDDAEKASKAASQFIKSSSDVKSNIISEKELTTIKEDARIIAASKNIAAQRKSFYQLSDHMIALTKEFKVSQNPVYVQYCPMAEASWLSDESKIINPYYGKSMLSCGNVKSVIK
ncbi:DUF3347 domain-containing protein [Chryseobacterium profundimaris]|uniref:DUF3347 domain-containing protein n=1 Tax=Chryseobacterium profundimaris TaxID=1387275 RepID=A0ABY1P7S6_9FLAO|nr:DUF3347 domain-containing protein [Chryseobacterium profundimaris]SMP28282.1 Protein of unknown function [Chryseobacterium profundimaris]